MKSRNGQKLLDTGTLYRNIERENYFVVIKRGKRELLLINDHASD